MRWGNKLGSSLEIVKGAVDAGVASPGILLGTLLARPHVTDAPLVPDVADLGAGATLAVWVIAAKRREVLDCAQGLRVAHPLEELPVSDEPDVVHGGDGVQEGDEPFLVVRCGEPSGVVEQAEGSPVAGIVSLEVLDQHLVDSLSVGGRGAGVAHGATAASQVLPHHHGHLPDSRIRVGGAGWDHAVMEDLIIQGVRPAGGFVLIHRHG